jgi:predicted RNA-binding protein with RPS1 domain
LELSIGQTVRVKVTEKDDERRRISLSIKQALPEWQERAQAAPPKRPARREFEREFGPVEVEPEPITVDASLEAILQELKERGIGRR